MEPITRKEKFLAAAGGQDVDLPTPVTREETFLKAIAEGGGGGGSDLPDVTAADNGKVLGVVNGEWNKVNAPAGTFICTFSQESQYGTITCDKTITEIDEAYKAGKTVIGIASYNMLPDSTSFGKAIMNLTEVNYLNASTATNPNRVTFTGISYAFDDILNRGFYEIFTITGQLMLSVNFWEGKILNLQVPTLADNGKTVKIIGGSYYYEDLSPLVVTYTITGQPTGNVYPLSSDTEINDILSAIMQGRIVKAKITVDGNTIFSSYFIMDDDVLSTNLIAMMNNTLVCGFINQIRYSESEESTLTIIPIVTS